MSVAARAIRRAAEQTAQCQTLEADMETTVDKSRVYRARAVVAIAARVFPALLALAIAALEFSAPAVRGPSIACASHA